MSPEDRSKVTSAGWAKMKGGAGFLYAARLPDGMVKIGFALEPAKRVKEFKAEIIATVRGTREQEHELHRQLVSFRIPSYGGRPDAREFYVPAVIEHGPVPKGFRRGVQLHPKPTPKPRAKFSRDAEVIALHDAGRLTLQAVGDKLGLTRERVRQILVRNNVPVRKGIERLPIEISKERFDRYKKALKPGIRTTEALAAAGLTLGEVYGASKVLGVPMPKIVRQARLRYREIAEYYTSHPDLTGNDLARHFGVNPNTVSRALSTLGVRSRQSGWKWKRINDPSRAAA